MPQDVLKRRFVERRVLLGHGFAGVYDPAIAGAPGDVHAVDERKEHFGIAAPVWIRHGKPAARLLAADVQRAILAQAFEGACAVAGLGLGAGQVDGQALAQHGG